MTPGARAAQAPGLDRPLRVLHLPTSAASVPSHSVEALRRQGVDARGLVVSAHPYEDVAGLEVCCPPGTRRWGPAWAWGRFARASSRFVDLVRWADVVHWYSSGTLWPGGLDLRLVRSLRKPAVVQWMGSDIRSAEREAQDNPVFAKLLAEGRIPEAYRLSAAGSRRRQERFRAAGFAALVPPELAGHVDPAWGARRHATLLPLPVDRMAPAYPDPDKDEPLVVHVPSNPAIKGTAFVEAAVAKASRKARFRYETLTGLPRPEALRCIARADIVLDQFVLGAHGALSLEAMAFGKPVLCYIKASLDAEYPPGLPIVRAAPDQLADRLAELAVDGAARRDAGRAGRAYVERHHALGPVGRGLLDAYHAELRRREAAP